jgi:hypothetical protein
MEEQNLIREQVQILPKTDIRRSALIEWLCDEYPIKEATRQISEAKIWEKAGVITIQYLNGVKDIVEITDNGVELI